MKSGCKLLAVTPGEPAGIGPDIVLSAWSSIDADLLVVACPDVLKERAAQLDLDIPFHDYSAGDTFVPGALNVFPVPARAKVTPGHLNPANAAYVLDTLERAVSLCEAGICHAMVTGPVNKAIINDAGVPFSGHTEWLEARTGASHVVMMLATEGLRVALATTHLPLRQVADAITPALIDVCVRTLASDLRRRFSLAAPRIVVLGLNPHAGESGHLGREEIDVIIPALERLRRDGIDVIGPLPADTAFTPHILADCDIVLAMYHDQGLPVLKYKGFGDAANITLGLPIIRTSVDHGTALDIAGKGSADTGSLRTAIAYAKLMT